MKGFFSILLCTAMLSFPLFLRAQETEYSFFEIVDDSNSQPLVYATVIMTRTGIGVISDEKGNFRIPNRFIQANDTLRISSIGYRTTKFNIISSNKGNIQQFRIKRQIEALNEVVLNFNKKQKNLSARRIVIEAIKKIQDNYSRTPFAFTAYYRDYQKIIDAEELEPDHPLKFQEYVNLNEGIVKVFDEGFGTNKYSSDLNQAVLFSYGLNKSFYTDSVLSRPYDNYNEKYLKNVTVSPLGGNELYLLHIGDAVRNHDVKSFSFVDVLENDFVRNHHFKIDKLMYQDEEAIYKIDFTSSVLGMDKYFKASGSIYIDKHNFAIHQLQYVNRDARSKAPLYEVNVAYKNHGDQFYLNYLMFNNYFDVKHGDIFKVEKVNYHYESDTFTIVFNHGLNADSIRDPRRQFNFYYKKKRIEIVRINIVNQKTIRVAVFPFDDEVERKEFPDDIAYDIKNLQDVLGNTINQGPTIKVKQYRELFVQEVETESGLNKELKFVKKTSPLAQSEIYIKEGIDKFWVNSPLKESEQ
ncbi:carboxypeptidase-like regulatory domain-containing protein [Lutimonas zeaxanthinifaciens]|uniref:carboxypeptidase-like regulatory domain-containing protein n=1 Tax=Lutimonas zeaxanthinifaciens TaxID=3060215 RepID=UPI00265D3045|nr:carboxypeptidase-like regulatory domain-containing protein [Lutimonas sp. YSD2104]WKK64601.1 carboxypeptidase-like regulatory domain-containing protein [Lutimonas sp. YSD2104]